MSLGLRCKQVLQYVMFSIYFFQLWHTRCLRKEHSEVWIIFIIVSFWYSKASRWLGSEFELNICLMWALWVMNFFVNFLLYVCVFLCFCFCFVLFIFVFFWRGGLVLVVVLVGFCFCFDFCLFLGGGEGGAGWVLFHFCVSYMNLNMLYRNFNWIQLWYLYSCDMHLMEIVNLNSFNKVLKMDILINVSSKGDVSYFITYDCVFSLLEFF